jgi:hypothetical protein
MAADELAGRAYARVYQTSGRSDLHRFLIDAVTASGGRVLFASQPTRAPVFLGVQGAHDERIGVLAYPFRATHRLIRNRPADEHRLQIRYGAEPTWGEEHVVGRDIAGVDTSVVLGVHVDAGLLIGLDPFTYDPLPMGISVELKSRDIEAGQAAGWHVIERDNIGGSRRPNPRAPDGLETVVIFRPERFLDYVRLERQAADLGLDPALRYTLAAAAAAPPADGSDAAIGAVHYLEREFAMSAQAIMDVIAHRNRLSVAVRGGVAEYHLERQLRADPNVASVERLDADARPDFDVTMTTGHRLLVECKNCSPRPYANGDLKVEVQKTRATQGDPAGRLYRRDQFDIVATCVFPATHEWAFRFRKAKDLTVDLRFNDRLAPLQRVDGSWYSDLAAAL